MEKERHSIKRIFLLIFGISAMIIALWNILPPYIDYWISGRTYDQLENDMVNLPEGATFSEEDLKEQKEDWWLTDVTIEFDKLKEKNPEIVAWIRFDNPEQIDISYPVLYSGDNKKYLRKDLYGSEHIAGSIFLEGLNKKDFSDYYNIIYGHNMNDGSMFGSLKKYKEDGFWQENQYFTLYTEDMAYRYLIFSFQNAANGGEVYKIGYQPGDEYQTFIDNMVNESMLYTGIHPENTDKILTLSTCTSSGYANRFAVHAVCVDEQTTNQKLLKPEEFVEKEQE